MLGAVDADFVLGRELRKASALLQVLNHKPVTPPLCQAGIGMDMHGSLRYGSMGPTSPRSDLTLACQLDNLLRQNT